MGVLGLAAVQAGHHGLMPKLPPVLALELVGPVGSGEQGGRRIGDVRAKVEV